MPSKSAYSSGWSSTWTASRLSSGSSDGPLAPPTTAARRPLQAQVVVDAARGVLLHDEDRRRAGPLAAERLGRGARASAWRDTLRAGRPRRRLRRSAASPDRAAEWGGTRRMLGSYGMIPAMAARSIASATISFGLVSIPVKLYSTAKSSEHLTSTCSPSAVAAQAAVHLPQDDDTSCARRMVKGYEFAKDQYVTVHRRGAKALEAEPTRDRDHRVRAARQVDPIYFEKAYYLGPRQGRRARLPAARRGDARDRPRGARPVRGARQAVPGAAAAVRRTGW